MREFKLDRAEWYAARDDRTRRVDGSNGFEDVSVGVIIEPGIDRNYSTQVMALVAVNILARWCRDVRIQMPAATSCLPFRRGQDLEHVCEEIMACADPYGNFTFGDVREEDSDLILVIGQVEETFQRPQVWINGSGWVAGVHYGAFNTPFTSYEDHNPVGSAFAACLGAAEIYRQAIHLPRPAPHSTWYSLYDFEKTTGGPDQLRNPKYTPEFDFGRIHQVGCGAVGSSLDFLLSLTEWKAKMDLIDFDKVEPTNCNRSLSFSGYDAVCGRRKIDACAEVLKSSTISPTTFEGSYGDFIGEGRYLDTPPDLILCLANERNVWTNVQCNFPPVVFHATTTPNWAMNFGRHIPKKEWCILCRFSREIKHNFTPQCSEGEIGSKDGQEGPILGVLPFLSPASAVLILAEMAKMSIGGYPVTKNFMEFSMKPPGGGIFSLTQRGPDPGCICHEQPLDLYPSKIKGSKFWRLVG